MIDFLKSFSKESPEYVFFLLVFFCVMFRQEIGSVLKDRIKNKLTPLAKKKEVNSSKKQTAPPPSHLIRYTISTSANFYEGIVNDLQAYKDDIFDIIDQQREKGQKLTFNFIRLEQVNTNFVLVWRGICNRVLQENNISIQIVFPAEPTSQLQKLFVNIQSDIETSNRTSIILRKDQRGKKNEP